jgi:pimeloyl-ACP methyl ester carboxylesterase
MLTLTGCKGIDKLAQSSLYPFEQVMKQYPVQPVVTGTSETVLHDRTHVIYGGTGDTVLLYFHGNGENLTIMQLVKMDKALEKFGSYVIVDYPQLGLSKGDVDQAGLLQAAQDAYEFAKTRGKTVVLWGRSLGAAVAIQLAHQVDVNKLIVTSGWTTFHEAALSKSKLARLVSKEWLAANAWDSVSAAKKFKGDVLMLHGDKDDLVKFELGKELSKNFEKVKFVTVEGAGHNDIFQFPSLWISVGDFLGVK